MNGTLSKAISLTCASKQMLSGCVCVWGGGDAPPTLLNLLQVFRKRCMRGGFRTIVMIGYKTKVQNHLSGLAIFHQVNSA